MTCFRTTGFAILMLHATGLSAQVPAETEARLRAIFEREEFNARSVQATWLPDGSGYTVLETPSGATASELVQYDAASGTRSVLVSLEQLVTQGTADPLSIENYALSPDGEWLLLETRHDEGFADFWTLDFSSGALRSIASRVAGSLPGDPISPDGQAVLYTDQNNLRVYDRKRDRTISLTSDGSPGSVSNGRATWSPDSRHIAYVRSDASDVRLRPMLIAGDPTYPTVREVRFARIGETIPTLRLGIVDAAGGETMWPTLPAPDEGFYFGQISWLSDSEELIVEQRSRSRDMREFFVVHTRAGVLGPIYHESDSAWVVASYRTNGGLEWINDERDFVLLTEKDGWRHAYVVSRTGGEERLLTPGESDVIERGMVDAEERWFYHFMSPDNATQRYLYRVPLDGTKGSERVTPASQSGWHDYAFSPDAKWALHTYSTFDTPPVTELVQLPEHRVVRVIEDNGALRDRAAQWTTRPTEFMQLDIGDGVVIDGYMIKPRDFDPSRRYPVFVYVYSEPHAQTVLDRWSTRNLYHRAIADLGYLVVSMDSRGTPAPKGAAWRRAIFGSLGPLSTEEQAAGLQELGRIRPYVDLSRVGIWGWSGGGSNTLNAMFRKPDVYHVGIAVVPKPQPHLYNAWFQEIYMRTPATNPEGYEQSAPINFAEGLRGDLLIVHGTGETNTHLEIAEGLVDRLIELGKPFDYMAYPNRNHGLREGVGTTLHVRMLMVRYLLAHLAPGGR